MVVRSERIANEKDLAPAGVISGRLVQFAYREFYATPWKMPS